MVFENLLYCNRFLDNSPMTLPATSAPHALAGILDAILIGGENGIEAGLDYESQAFGLCFSTEDMREGTKAFLERRKPNFTGA